MNRSQNSHAAATAVALQNINGENLMHQLSPRVVPRANGPGLRAPATLAAGAQRRFDGRVDTRLAGVSVRALHHCDPPGFAEAAANRCWIPPIWHAGPGAPGADHRAEISLNSVETDKEAA